MSKIAACVYIFNPTTGQIVLTTRRPKEGQPTRYGLPGGKADPGENAVEAAIRETFEETGIQLDYINLEYIFEEICEGEVPYHTTSYYAEYDGEIPGGSEEEIQSLWGTRDVLINESPFAEYNKNLLECIDNW